MKPIVLFYGLLVFRLLIPVEAHCMVLSTNVETTIHFLIPVLPDVHAFSTEWSSLLNASGDSFEKVQFVAARASTFMKLGGPVGSLVALGMKEFLAVGSKNINTIFQTFSCFSRNPTSPKPSISSTHHWTRASRQ